MCETCYYLYIDRVNRSAMLHLGRCVYCHHGQGVNPDRNANDNVWRGPFVSPEEARTHVPQRFGQRECSVCL